MTLQYTCQVCGNIQDVRVGDFMNRPKCDHSHPGIAPERVEWPKGYFEKMSKGKK